MHRLLKKQIRDAKASDGSFDAARLLELVSNAYAKSDDRRMKVREARSASPQDGDCGICPAETGAAICDLKNAIENVNQGIAMIDAKGRILVINARYRELTGLSRDDIKASPTLSSILKLLEKRGEFASMDPDFTDWLKKGQTRAEHPFSYRRTRPDGTVLQVQVTPLPDGNELRTLTDITEHLDRADEINAMRRTLELTIENVTQGIIKFDSEHRVVVFNHRAEEILDFPPGLLRHGVTMRELIAYQVASGEFGKMTAEFEAFLKAGGLVTNEQVYVRQRPNGRYVEFRTIPLPDGSSVRTYADVTEAHERQVALERTKEEYRSLFENSIVGIFRSTLDGRQLRANPALVRLNGYENEEEMLSDVLDIGKQWYVDPNRRREFIDMMDQDGRVSDFVSEVYRCKTREKIWVSEAVWLVRDEEGNPAYYEGMVTDASARRAAEKKIAHIALHDMLTNLPNRTLFQESLSLAISENRRGHELALLCLDLDHFKDVNDTMGHDCGDILLRLAARRIARSLPAGGMAARFGGDEFAVLLPNIRGRDYVMHLAREIVAKLSRPFRIRGKRVFVGASIGIAIAPTDGNDAKELLKKADIALYRAKRDGRGTYSCFDEGMTAAIHARREIEQDLRRAIEREEFRLVYQPIIDLESNAPNGYEALVRWEHPTKGLLAPAHFIEVAEESGLIVQIGEIVLRQACSCIVRNHKTASVSVNLSPIQFRNHHLTASVLSALAASRLPASRLVLEITESVLLTDDTRTLEILQQLRALGVRIALDDFGIGHSSLSYLQKFPFDRIKIDKSFVQEAEDGMMNTAIRRAILGLGNDIGIEIVVEGVETEEQRNMLIYEGCRYVQGYFYGRPQPEEEVFSDSRSADAVRKAG